ncbi:aldehyde-activating protein [Sphingomonas sp. Leaf357]|uniref:GFA family protein n=1 Tax=Sphingomonas sp. Leaf357 TaxID=1736350 RepID=UPI0006F213FD|nr:GFA family protein [Sphingomonas sp. Leaf357]KQS04485.1 aldehyde-activating protein [Sphingomonas sp. Leaf357]
MTITGGCHCGACRYTLALGALPKAYACHCRTCQTWSGSAFSEQVLVMESAIAVTGPVVDYVFQSPSGSQSHQRMCGVCHVRLYNTNTMRAGIAVVRAGSLDRSDELDVPLHIWVKRKQPWVRLPEGAESYEEAAPPEAIVRLFSR